MNEYKIKHGPNEGYWITKDGENILWCYDLKYAELRLAGLLNGTDNGETPL